MTIRRSFTVLARNISLLALLGCLAACQMPFGMGQRAPEPKPQPVAPAPAAGPCVVLALPSSGPYAAIAGKVRHGAQMAQNELATNGIKLRVETINTEAPDWLQRLDALPQACTVVGGPLQARNYAQAREHGSLEKRATKAHAHGVSSPVRKTRSTRSSALPALASISAPTAHSTPPMPMACA